MLLGSAVGLGFPAGALVVGAGVIYGTSVGLAVVLAAQAAGLLLNWWLYRGVLRPRVERWLARQTRQARWQWLQHLQQQGPGLQLMLLLRLAAIPMNLVNASCALGPTAARPYALACLMLVPRFTLMVWAGDTGAEASRGQIAPLTAAARLVAVMATGAVLAVLAQRSLNRQRQR